MAGGMRRLFGTSGIRGRLDGLLTPELASKVGLAFAELLGEGSVVAVGSDHRLPSRPVKHAVIAGLLAGGVDVLDLGVVPTPALLHYVKVAKLDGAVMVTGSHTPPEFTGLLLFRSDTGELRPEEEHRVEELVLGGKLAPVSWSRVGSVERVEDAVDVYVAEIVRRAPRRLSGEAIVVDCGNSPQALALPRLVSELGGEPHTLNENLDPLYRGRDPYPRPEVLAPLGEAVREKRAILGIAVDGDGDRALFADEKGVVHWGDVIGALFAEEELESRGGGAVVCPVNTSLLIERVVTAKGGRVVYTKVGPPAIAEGIRRNPDAIFGFEETGKFIWPDNVLYGDPGYALARLLEIIGRRGPLSEIVSSYPEFHRIKRAYPIADELKEAVLGIIRERAPERWPDGLMVELDGVKVLLGDSWVLMRPSGTEPVFRIYAESPDRELAEKLVREAEALLREALRDAERGRGRAREDR